jgi:coenzyme Q-binding protein COQ10
MPATISPGCGRLAAAFQPERPERGAAHASVHGGPPRLDIAGAADQIPPMPSFRTTRRVPHSPQEMFDLVADVERYPEFLPLCTGLRVIRRAQDEAGREVLVAEMSIGYRSIAERFTTRVALDRKTLDIHVSYVNGPFRYLENRWEFRPDEAAGCTVNFSIDYEFRSIALGLLMGAMFDRAFRRFTQAFEDRADDVYGREPVGKTGA